MIPNSIAISGEATALMTEAHPLIPQAHGTKVDRLLDNFVNPKGKGIPIKNANGASINIEIKYFRWRDKWINELNIMGNKK